MINIQLEINKLLKYGLDNRLIQAEDFYHSANKIISLLNLSEFTEMSINEEINFYEVLADIMQYSFASGIIKASSDTFDSALMDCLTPRPSEINKKFWFLYNENPKKATDYFYDLSKKTNYIRCDRISKNISWKTATDFGKLDITINLSKPEKDPKEIEEAKNQANSTYPRCLLCRENEGFSGYPGRANHRLIGLNLLNEKWYLQYSPYVYYNEHCVVLSHEHVPMKISDDTFRYLLEFVSLFPHYFIGSNADLPIVGGSILAHEHFQGGRYEFAMMRQPLREIFTVKGYEDVECGILNWPMSVIRLKAKDKEKLISLGSHILRTWRRYADESSELIPFTGNIPHNTITPIARMSNNLYELYLVLRNNRTTEIHPLGIFHPHKEHHHLKKENIGLIEVMGLAVLPPRLIKEIPVIRKALLENTDLNVASDMGIHQKWLEEIKNKYHEFRDDTIDEIIKTEIGLKFKEILIQCGVFKNLDSFRRFINILQKGVD